MNSLTRKFYFVIFLVALLSACSIGGQKANQQSNQINTQHTINSASAEISSLNKTQSLQVTHALDGLSFSGSVRASGVMGLFAVKGELLFEDGKLIWIAQGDKDIGPYQTSQAEDGTNFTAQHIIENNEQISWSGFYDGETLQNVRAIWTRNKGDFVHDLLLPDKVILDFKTD